MKKYTMRLIIYSGFLILFACSREQSPAVDPDIYYTCSMDPQVVEYQPGKCPICKMELTPVRKNDHADPGVIQLSDQQMELGNIRVDTIRMAALGEEIVLTATVNLDQNKTTALSSRIMGRVERLYVKTIGDYVQKGAPVYDLYSEELNNAKQEYVVALQKRAELGNSQINFDQLIRRARTRLELWGLTEAQIKALEKPGQAPSPTTTFYSPQSGFITSVDITEGAYVMEGGGILRLADLSTLWVEAQLYSSQLSDIDLRAPATITFPDLPGTTARGRIGFVNPEINPDTRINLVRIQVNNPGGRLRPGMPAYVRLSNRERKTLALPIDAVIRDSRGASVWIKVGDHEFKSVRVETGLETASSLEIRSGLEEGDAVVVSGAYLLNSEFVFKKGAGNVKSEVRSAKSEI